MKTNILVIKLLLGSSSMCLAKSSDFSDIEMAESVVSKDYDLNAKTVKFDIKKSKDYKDLVTDKILRSHLSVNEQRPIYDEDEDQDQQDIVDDFIPTPSHKKFSFDVDDFNSMSYFTTIYLGSQKEEVNLAFDTNSPISVVNTNNCEGCDPSMQGFEYQRSHTVRKISDNKIDIQIEGQDARGVLVYDDLWLSHDSDLKVSQFPFLLVNTWEQTKFQQVDGVIGLSKSYWQPESFTQSGPALLNALYQSNQISQKVFSVHFDNYGGSQIEMGGFDTDKMAPGVPLTFFETPYSSDWQFTINGFRVGEKPLFPSGAKTAYYFEEFPAKLDTFSPYIKIPKSIGVQAFNNFFHETHYEVVDDLLVGPCDLDQYWSISLFINDRYYVKLAPESFVIDIGQGDKCFIPFQYNDVDEWVLGEPFFRSFYAVFDDSKGIVGLAPSVNFMHASIIEGIVPNDKLNHPEKQNDQQIDEHPENLPNMNNPIDIFKYMCKTAFDALMGKSDDDDSSSNNNSNSGLITTFIMATSLFCLGNLILLYCCYEYYKWSKQGGSKQAGMRKRAKSTQNVQQEQDGVSLASLLNEEAIQDKINTLKGKKKSKQAKIEDIEFSEGGLQTFTSAQLNSMN